MGLWDAHNISSSEFSKTTAARAECHERAAAELDLFEHCLVRPGSRFVLEAIDPDFHSSYESPQAAQAEIDFYRQRLDRLHHVMHAEDKHSLLIVLQGIDASGKSGVARHLVSCVNPAGCRVVQFRQPSQDHLRHDFLWRVHPHVPRRGEMAIFNRSHYEDVLAVRVHQVVSAESCGNRFELINQFEKLLTLENGTTVLKFLLHISSEEQLARLKRRLDDPDRRWKIRESDYSEREYSEDYMKAYEDALGHTSTVEAPWFVIPSNHKWFRDLAVLQIIVRAMEGLKMKVPAPAIDLARIRRKYHEVEGEAEAKAS